MSVVLVYPFRRDASFGAGPPLGLLYLASSLNKHNFDASVIDLVGEESPDEEVVSGIVRKKPALVGFPVYSTNMKAVYDLISLLRQNGYSGKIILGAQHATGLPDDTLTAFQEADYLIRYEAELPLIKLADYLINGKGQVDGIENLYYRQGVIKHTVDVPSINKNLDDLPFPDRSLLDKYFKKGIYRRPYVRGDCDFIITSRGCPFRCNFCFPSAPSFRVRSSGNILDELKYLKGLGRKHVEVMDDSFTINTQMLKDTLIAIRDAKLNLSLKIRSRVDVIDDKIVKLMKSAGVQKIVYGIESGSDRMLKAMNKRVTAAQNADAIRIAKKAGIACFADLFIGYPGEDLESVEETTRFLIRTKPFGINIGAYYPLPLTVGYETAKNNGSLVGEWSHLHTRSPYVQLEWVKDYAHLCRTVRSIRRRFYSDPAVCLQTALFILRNTRASDMPRVMKAARGFLGR